MTAPGIPRSASLSCPQAHTAVRSWRRQARVPLPLPLGSSSDVSAFREAHLGARQAPSEEEAFPRVFSGSEPLMHSTAGEASTGRGARGWERARRGQRPHCVNSVTCRAMLPSLHRASGTPLGGGCQAALRLEGCSPEDAGSSVRRKGAALHCGRHAVLGHTRPDDMPAVFLL